jgi:putative membrane protein
LYRSARSSTIRVSQQNEPQNLTREADMREEQITIEELILRDHLALDRTRLANERTLLAYLRTALMLLVAGASAVKFVGKSHDVIITGWVFIGLAVVVAVLGTSRFVAMQRKINSRHAPARRQ